MPDVFPYTILVAFAAGTLHAIALWRASTKVGVVNVVVIGTLAEGRGADLPEVLRASGSGIYLDVARSITEPTEKLLTGRAADVRQRLERDCTAALMAANRALRRHAWLDSVALSAVAFSVVGVLATRHPSLNQVLATFAATLLWVSNMRAARSISTQLYSGATTLVDSLIDGLDAIRTAAPSSSTPRPSGNPPAA